MEQLFTPSAAEPVHNPHSSSSPLEEAQRGEDSHSALAATGNVSSKSFYSILLYYPAPLVQCLSGVGLPGTAACSLHEYPEVQKKGTLVQVLMTLFSMKREPEICFRRTHQNRMEAGTGPQWALLGFCPEPLDGWNLTMAPAEARPPFPAGAGLGLWVFYPVHRQPDPGVSAQNIYYTSLKPTNAAPAPGGSPDTPRGWNRSTTHIFPQSRDVTRNGGSRSVSTDHRAIPSGTL